MDMGDIQGEKKTQKCSRFISKDMAKRSLFLLKHNH